MAAPNVIPAPNGIQDFNVIPAGCGTLSGDLAMAARYKIPIRQPRVRGGPFTRRSDVSE